MRLTKQQREVMDAWMSENMMTGDHCIVWATEELAPLLGLADGIVDIVETGRTLKENGLEIAEYVSDISARLIVNVASLKLKKNDIENFIERIERCL